MRLGISGSQDTRNRERAVVGDFDFNLLESH